MRRVAALAAIVLLTAAACSNEPSEVTVSAPGDNAAGITVSGEGEVTGTPDVLSIALGVSVKRDTVDAAVSEAATLADRLVETLKAAGVEETDIQTQNYSIQPEFRYSQGEEIPDGFRVDNTVRVKLRELDRAGEVIDAASEAGGDQVRVQGVTFSLEDNEALLTEAREKAWEDAARRPTSSPSYPSRSSATRCRSPRTWTRSLCSSRSASRWTLPSVRRPRSSRESSPPPSGSRCASSWRDEPGHSPTLKVVCIPSWKWFSTSPSSSSTMLQKRT